jgi:Lipoxygenase
MSLQQEFALVERSEQYKLPHLRLRELGLHNVPAVPVDVGGMLDTLLKLGLRAKQREQAYQALTKTFTIGGTTARAYTFLFGAQSTDAQPAAAREQAQAFLSNASALSPSNLAATLRKQDEALAHSSNETAADPLTMLPLEDPKQFSLSWTTFPNVYAVGEEHLDEWAETLDVTRPEKATEAFFPTIAHYGMSYNLLLTQKVPSAKAPPWRELFGEAWTSELDAAAEAGLLYVIDLRIYEKLDPHHLHGLTRFTPSTVVVLVQDDETKAMTPELIRVAGGPNEPKIFSRQGSTTASAWVYALQAAKCSITVYGIWIGHVFQWHIVTAAMQMTMFETLSGSHPVRRLLQPHSSYLIPFDDVLLINWDAAAVPPTSIATGWQFLQLLELYTEGRGFFDDDPTTTLQRLGISATDFTVDEPWDQYPVIGQLMEIWDATGRYVNTYVDHAYPTDEDVQHDEELHSWMTASGSPDGGNLRGLRDMSSKEELKRVLHSLVHRITAHGFARLWRSGEPALLFVANFPPCLHDTSIPDPADSFDTRALLRFLPRTGPIGQMVHFYFTFHFSPPYVPFVPIAGPETDLYFDDEVSNQALIDLRRFIVGFTERFQPDTPQIWQWPRNIET